MKVFNIIIHDDELGEIHTGESFTNRSTANHRASELRKTFRDVEVRPGRLTTGDPRLKKHAAHQQRQDD